MHSTGEAYFLVNKGQIWLWSSYDGLVMEVKGFIVSAKDPFFSSDSPCER